MLLSNRSGICAGNVPLAQVPLTELTNGRDLSTLRSRKLTFAVAALLSFAFLVPCAHSQSANFTIIALPDTQWYSESYPQTFTAQTQWIVNNASTLNIQVVLGLGDIVQTASNAWEYQNADTSVKLLDNANIPYLLAIGNHDYSNFQDLSGRTSEAGNFNTYFGPSRYKNYPWYKGQYPAGSNENFYGILTINGKTYLFLLLETFPRDSAVAWGNSVLAAYPSAEVIVITHAHVYTDNTLASHCDNYNAPAYNVGADNDGDGLWNKFISQHSNISLVLSGHFTGSNGQGASRRTDLGSSGNIVNQMLSDYQDLPNGGEGYLRILTFSQSQNTISVKTYSPTLNAYLTDSNNQFTVPWHATGPNPSGTGTIAGRVKDFSSCNAISAATVSTTGSSGTTDSNGNFTFNLSTPSTATVTAQAGAYGSAVKSINAWTGYPTFTKYFLSTEAPGTISGSVTDSSGRGISGATVSYSDGSATSDANGNYTIANVLVGSYTVTAWVNGYQTASTQNVNVNSGATTTTNFVLSGFGSIAGTVLNSSGAAVAGASVSYSGGSTTTASNGAYTLSNIPVGTYSLTASAAGYQNSTQSNVTVTANTTTTVNLTLPDAGAQTYSISGTISPSSSGSGTTLTLSAPAPVLVQSAHGSNASGNSSATVSFGAASKAGSTIVVFARFGGPTVSSISDNQAGGSNSYTSVLGPTQWGVSPNPNDRWAQVFIAKNITGGSVLTITVNLAGGSTHPIYLAALEYSGVDPANPVNATATGTGKVSQNGAPTTGNLTTTTANAKLVATSWDSNESYGSSGNGTGYTTDAAAGAASLTGGPGWANLTEDSTAASPGTWNATTSSAPEVDDWALQLIALAPAPGGAQTATADANGNFTFSNVSNGIYVVTPSKSGVTFIPATQSLTINGGNVSGVSFTTTTSAGMITGTVTGSGGTVAGAAVSYSGGSATTGSNGGYTLSNVPAGTVSVTASATGYQSSTQSVTVTANATTSQNFTLSTAAGTVAGTVTNSSGTALAGATVSYSGGSTVTASNGSYTLSNIQVGTFTVTASAAGYQNSIQSVTVSANTTTTQNFTLSLVPQTYSVLGTISPASSASGTLVALTGAVPLLVQTARGSAANGFSSATVSFGAPAGAGDTIVLFARFGGTTVSSVTDNQPGGTNTYTSVLGPTQWGVAPNPTDRYAQVFVAKNVPGGIKLTITVKCAAPATRTIYLAALEYSGVDPVNPINATASATGTIATNGAPSTGNLTTTIANTKLVATGWDSNDSYTSTSNGAGFTTNTLAGLNSLTGGSGWVNLTEDNTASAPGNWMATTTASQAVSDWAIQLIALTPAGSQTVTADASGNYAFNGVTNGVYTVTPTKSASSFTPANQSVTVNGANASGVNFTITSTGTITGTVTNSSGTAITGATVSYSGGSTSTAGNGAYTFSNVPAGTVSITASATGYQSSTQGATVTANTTTTQNFTLLSAVGTVAGTVTNSGGTAIAGATVSYSSGSTTTAGNGTYTLSNIPPGTVSITASATGYQSSTQNVTVTANTTTTQNFTLLASGTQIYSIQGTISPASIGSGSSVALGGSVPVLVQSAHGSSATGTSSTTLSFTIASTAGHAILIFTKSGGNKVSSITDNQSGGSNTYTSVLGPTQWGVSPNPTDRWGQVFVAKNIKGGTVLTVTVKLAGSSTHPIYAVAVEYSGVDPVNPINATAVGTGKVSQNGAPTTSNLTTTMANAKLVATGWDSNESYGSTGNGTGYATSTAAGDPSLTGGPGWANLTEDKTAATTGSWNATTGTSPEVDDWVIQVVALAPAGIQAVTADANGNYSFSALNSGTYTITPSQSGHTFSPASQSVIVNNANATGVNFSAQ